MLGVVMLRVNATASVNLPTYRCTLRSFFLEMSDLQVACAAFILMNYIKRKIEIDDGGK
jgi:hypothetical protein